MAEPGGFIPIRVSTLRGDLKIPFDVYVKVAGKFIHYCRQGESFEGKRLDRLRAKKLKLMYVRSQDDIPYRQYLEESIDQAYKKSDKALNIRMEVIQGFQQAAAEEYIDDPSNKFTYEHVRASVQRMVEFLTREPRAIQALLMIQNTDASISHHGVNVAALSVAIAMTEGLREGHTLDLLALGCLLHDLDHCGNQLDLTVPLKSLNRSDNETYRHHPMAGAKKLQASPFVDGLVLNIVLQHEENLNGTGFPKGLTKDQMDPLVMVAATANAYDRMVSFDKMEPKEAIKNLFIEKLGLYPLNHLQTLQKLLKLNQVI